MIWRKPRHFACIIHSNSSPHPPLAASQPQPKRTSVNRDHFVSLFSCPALIREQPRANPCHRKWPWSMTLSAPVSTHYRSPLVPIIIALTFNARYPPPNLISRFVLLHSFENHPLPKILFQIVHPTTSCGTLEFIILPPTIRRPLISRFLPRILLRDFSRFLQLSDALRYRITEHPLLQLSPTILLISSPTLKQTIPRNLIDFVS